MPLWLASYRHRELHIHIPVCSEAHASDYDLSAGLDLGELRSDTSRC